VKLEVICLISECENKGKAIEVSVEDPYRVVCGPCGAILAESETDGS